MAADAGSEPETGIRARVLGYSLILFAVSIAFTEAMGGQSSATPPLVDLGDLVCTVGPTIESSEAVAGKSHQVTCVFVSSIAGADETYSGKLLTVGDSEDLEGQPVVIWAVRGLAAARGSAGLLAQTFAGSVADADGMKGPLAGDTNSSVVLALITKRDPMLPGKPITASIELKLLSTLV